MIGGGNAVPEQLPLGFRQRQPGGKIHARTGLQLALESVAMDVDDAGQHFQPTRI